MASENEEIIVGHTRSPRRGTSKGGSSASPLTGPSPTQSIGVTYQGPKELPFTVQNYGTAFPDMHRELFRLYEDGNIVAVQNVSAHIQR